MGLVFGTERCYYVTLQIFVIKKKIIIISPRSLRKKCRRVSHGWHQREGLGGGGCLPRRRPYSASISSRASKAILRRLAARAMPARSPPCLYCELPRTHLADFYVRTYGYIGKYPKQERHGGRTRYRAVVAALGRVDGEGGVYFQDKNIVPTSKERAIVLPQRKFPASSSSSSSSQNQHVLPVSRRVCANKQKIYT